MDWVDREFIQKLSSSLLVFKTRGDDYNFRCPYCGDSRRSSSKARGWLVHDRDGSKYWYHCYNCSKSASLRDFIEFVRPALLQEYVAEKFKSKGTTLEDSRAIRAALTAKPVFESSPPPPPPEPGAPPLTRFPDVKRAVESEWALEYLASRKIPFEELDHFFAVDNIRDVSTRIEAYSDKKFRPCKAILLPYYGLDRGLAYLQARLVGEGDETPAFKPLRYITFELGGGGRLWGRHRVSDGQDIFVFEGVLDAVMVPGGVASGGVDLIRAAKLVKEEYPNSLVTLCYDDDWRRNRQVYEQVSRAASLNYNLVLSMGAFKDVNDMAVKGGMSCPEIQSHILSNRLTSLSARLEIAKVVKPWKQ